MDNILNTIAEYARERVIAGKKTLPLDALKERALALPKDNAFSFEKAIKKDGMSFICECKKASPSKGLIAEDFPYVKIAKEYEAAGASCISVLTEPKWFLGSDGYLKEITLHDEGKPDLKQGIPIMELQKFDVKEIAGGIFSITVVDNEGNYDTAYMSTKCDAKMRGLTSAAPVEPGGRR